MAVKVGISRRYDCVACIAELHPRCVGAVVVQGDVKDICTISLGELVCTGRCVVECLGQNRRRTAGCIVLTVDICGGVIQIRQSRLVAVECRIGGVEAAAK